MWIFIGGDGIPNIWGAISVQVINHIMGDFSFKLINRRNLEIQRIRHFIGRFSTS